MTGREKPKRKALHRGLDDIVNRDASLTSRLLGRVKAPAREPLEVPPPAADSPAHESASELRPRRQEEAAEVRRLDEARAELRTRPDVSISAGEESPAPAAAVPPALITFEQFVERWGFVMRSGGRDGKLRICQVLYENTFAAGRDTFFTSYEKLARLAGLEKKQCAINIRRLEHLGFVERLNIYNTATRQGTEFKLHLEQLPPASRRAPRHHHYDEDLPR